MIGPCNKNVHGPRGMARTYSQTCGPWFLVVAGQALVTIIDYDYGQPPRSLLVFGLRNRVD